MDAVLGAAPTKEHRLGAGVSTASRVTRAAGIPFPGVEGEWQRADL